MTEPTTDPVMEAVEKTPRQWMDSYLNVQVDCGDIVDEWDADRAELSRLRARVADVEAAMHTYRRSADEARADLAALVPLARAYTHFTEAWRYLSGVDQGEHPRVDAAYDEVDGAVEAEGAKVLAKLDAEVPRG